jgi:hypothetical protein
MYTDPLGRAAFPRATWRPPAGPIRSRIVLGDYFELPLPPILRVEPHQARYERCDRQSAHVDYGIQRTQYRSGDRAQWRLQAPPLAGALP